MKKVSWEIASRIRDAREKQGYTREAFEEKAQISAKFLYEVEYAYKDISATTLSKICKALNISADYILFGKDNSSDYSHLIRLLNQLDDNQIKLFTGIVKLMLENSPEHEERR